jgi:hypothetical protein
MLWRRGDDSFLPSIPPKKGAKPVYLTGGHDYANCAECTAVAASENRPVRPPPLQLPPRKRPKKETPDCGWTDEDAAHFIKTSNIDFGRFPYAFECQKKICYPLTCELLIVSHVLIILQLLTTLLVAMQLSASDRALLFWAACLPARIFFASHFALRFPSLARLIAALVGAHKALNENFGTHGFISWQPRAPPSVLIIILRQVGGGSADRHHPLAPRELTPREGGVAGFTSWQFERSSLPLNYSETGG